jgi:serine phosphatase RsbU (regulator of sigma subunit)
MDISLCILDNETNSLQFAGAYNSLLILRQQGEKYEIQKVPADKMPIGKHPKDTVSFTNHTISLQAKDRLYIFSDGYVSQFGGKKGGKFKSRRLHQLLVEIQTKRMKQQKTLVAERFESWMGDEEQVDDILLMGIEIS